MIKNFLRTIIYNLTLLVSKIFGHQISGVVLCYHSIDEKNWDFSISKQKFIQQINFMLENYEPWTVADLEKYLMGEKEATKPFFVVTFDDGYKTVLSTVDFLAVKNIKPAVFVLANPQNANRKELDNNLELLTKEDIIKLHKNGWVVGCHTDSHADMLKLSDKELDYEINTAKQTLENALNIEINYFAYPKGAYTHRILDKVKNSGYKLAFSMDHKLISKDTNRYAIPRVGIMHTHTLSEFKSLPLPLSTHIRSVYFRNSLEGEQQS